MTPGPELIAGGLHRDARGEVLHVNAFDFAGVDRGYAVRPAATGGGRGGVGRLRDTKWLFVPHGAFVLWTVAADAWQVPAWGLPIRAFESRDDAPAVLRVPPGFFTASVAPVLGSVLMVYSSGLIDRAGKDDFRVPPDHWPLPAGRRFEPRNPARIRPD